MKKYLRTYQNNGQTLQYYDEKQYMIDVGALTKNGAVVLKGVEEDKWGNIVNYERPIRMDVIADQFEQLRRWRQRKRYNKKIDDERSKNIDVAVEKSMEIELPATQPEQQSAASEEIQNW